MKTMKMEKDKRKSRESEITWVGGFSCQISSNGFFLISSSSSSLNHRLLVVVCVVNCKSLQVATYRHVSTLKRIWTMKNDFRTYDDGDGERER